MVYVSPVNDWLKAKYRRTEWGKKQKNPGSDSRKPFSTAELRLTFFLHQDAILALTPVWSLAVIKHTACGGLL